MKKLTIALVVILTASNMHQKAHAQSYKSWILFAAEGTDTRFNVRQPHFKSVDTTNISHTYNYFNNPEYFGISKDVKPRSPIMLGVLLNPKLTNYFTSDVKSYTKEYVSYIISDSTDAKIIALGITPDNSKDYKYHVVKNDSIEIVPWSPVRNMEKRYGAEIPFANLGTYNSPGDQILVEVVNTKDYSIRDGIIFDWRVDFTPRVPQIIVSTNRDYFNLNFSKLNRGYATQYDPKSGMPLDLAFPADSINNFRIYFENHETVPYEIYLKKETASDTSTTQIDYWVLGEYWDFSSKYFKEPGKYVLTIQRVNVNNRVKEDQKLHFKFEVLPPPAKSKSYSLLQFLYFGIGTLLFFSLLFLAYYFANKRKQTKINQQKQLIDLKLKSIQAQLNPHFMFNALSSIQNFMNKNDAKQANFFLGKFSKLTRRVLDAGDEEMISLEDELTILSEYLQMEQLRFNFNMEIKTNESINLANTEIPGMLLHPFVENAVKHGVSSLGREGMIRISLTKEDNKLLISVADNGNGFSEESIGENCLGIRLVKERIKLLNQLSGEQQIALKIESGKNGTTIILTLKNWF